MVRLAELEQAYRLRFREYCGLAGAILRDAEAGRDAVQEAFTHAVRGRERFRGDGPLDAWLWRLVVNAVLTERRRRRPEPAAELDLGSTPERVRHDDDLRAAIDALPDRQRLVLFLRYYADLDYAAIARALGIAPGTVAATLHAAHTALRTQLTEEVST